MVDKAYDAYCADLERGKRAPANPPPPSAPDASGGTLNPLSLGRAAPEALTEAKHAIEVASAGAAGMNAGASSLAYAFSRPIVDGSPIFSILGFDFGITNYYNEAWAESGIQGTWVETWTNRAAGTAAIAGYSALAVVAWSAAGGGQFAVSVSRGAGPLPHFTFGWGTGGTYTAGHGLGSGLYTTTYHAALGGYWNTMTGIPIISPTAVEAWVAIEPEVGNCLGAAIQAFFRGWGCYIIP